jgi:hypothetical protein
MKNSPPPKVQNVEEHWGHLPASPSLRCIWWVGQIKSGWKPNQRIRSMGYHEGSSWFGVWIEEYTKVIAPLLYSEFLPFAPLPPSYQSLVDKIQTPSL